jgi:hypothetical protein
MIGELLKWVAYCAVVAAVLYVGWREPLRYRFMSEAEITAERRILAPTPAPTPPPRSATRQGLQGTALDRAPWVRSKDGSIGYSLDHDYRRPGSYTESEWKRNTTGAR